MGVLKSFENYYGGMKLFRAKVWGSHIFLIFRKIPPGGYSVLEKDQKALKCPNSSVSPYYYPFTPTVSFFYKKLPQHPALKVSKKNRSCEP